MNSAAPLRRFCGISAVQIQAKFKRLNVLWIPIQAILVSPSFIEVSSLNLSARARLIFRLYKRSRSQTCARHLWHLHAVLWQQLKPEGMASSSDQEQVPKRWPKPWPKEAFQQHTGSCGGRPDYPHRSFRDPHHEGVIGVAQCPCCTAWMIPGLANS